MNLLQKIKDWKLKKVFSNKSCNIRYTNSGYFEYIDNIQFGDYIYIGPGAFWAAKAGIKIGNNVIFGPKTTIWTYNHDYRSEEAIPYGFQDIGKMVIIEDNCWIGYNAVIMPGVTVGEGSVIAACTVVTKDCPKGSVVAGNPGRIVKTRDMDIYEKLKAEQKFFLKMKYGKK